MKEAHSKFVKEYRRTGDPVKSALAAGSLERQAESDAKRWLSKSEIKEAVAAPEATRHEVIPTGVLHPSSQGRSGPAKRRAPSRRVTRKK